MIIEIILWIIFVASAILLSVVILLQEAKGGGLAEAFGGLGAQTFGVKASGINKFTAYVAAVFLLSAVLITCLRKSATVYEAPAPVPEGGANQTAPLNPGDMQPGQSGKQGNQGEQGTGGASGGTTGGKKG